MNNVIIERKFIAVVLAGDRTRDDPVASEAGVVCKAFTPIAGVPMVIRVIDALENCSLIESIIVCGPAETALPDCPELTTRLKNENINWIKNQDSPSKSVDSVLQLVDREYPVLVTTADHALITHEIVHYFAENSLATEADATVGLVDYEKILESFPKTKRTVIKLRDGMFCGCNLFTFLSVKGRELAPFWVQVEQQRKKPGKIVAEILGWWSLILYVIGQLKLQQVFKRVSTRLGMQIDPINLPFPRAGIDVDTTEDRKLVESIISN